MSRAFNGGSLEVSQQAPTNKAEVLSILKEFIRMKYKDPDIAQELDNKQDDHLLIFFADEGEQESPATLKQTGDLVAYGTFVYEAKEHPVQTIWENHFEIRETDSGVFVRVSNWYGTTVETWNKKVARQSIYV